MAFYAKMFIAKNNGDSLYVLTYEDCMRTEQT